MRTQHPSGQSNCGIDPLRLEGAFCSSQIAEHPTAVVHKQTRVLAHFSYLYLAWTVPIWILRSYSLFCIEFLILEKFSLDILISNRYTVF